MVMIRIRDHVASASTYEDGEVIFGLIAGALGSPGCVDVSFNGILSVPSAFVNSAFVRLVERFSLDEIKARVRFLDSTRSINDLLRRRLEFVGARASGNDGSN